MALKEKQEQTDQNSGMAPFEEAFHHFLNDELMGIAVQALHEEVEKTHVRLHDLIQQTEENLKRKDERLAELAQLERHVQNTYQSTNTAMVESDAKQELDELLYYVMQRVYYRYPDFFREAYNPSTFAQMPAQQALDTALKEVLQALSFDFAQEMRVTNFRLAQFVQKKMKERFKEDAQNLKEFNNSFSFLAYEPEEPSILDFTGPFAERSKYAGVKSFYRNPKSFFEKNEKEQLKDALEGLTKPDAQAYVEDEKERLQEWAFDFISKEAESLRRHLFDQAIEQIETERMLLQEESHLATWKEIYTQLQQ